VTGLECDILLFVATDTEQEALARAALDLGFEWSMEASKRGEFWKLGRVGRQRVVAVRTRIGSIGRSGSTANAHFYLAATQATGIVSLGMAFGISRARQQLGSILVSNSLFAYDMRRVVPDPDRNDGMWMYTYGEQQRPHPCRGVMSRIFREHIERGGNGLRAEAGCVLSGAAIVRSSAFRDQLVAWCSKIVPDIIGGEMEGAGFLSLETKTSWIVVKGICDFADEHQVADAQLHCTQAAGNSSRFVLEAIRDWNPGQGKVSI
jgi:adenosylhomocysteine nucleosidase